MTAFVFGLALGLVSGAFTTELARQLRRVPRPLRRHHGRSVVDLRVNQQELVEINRRHTGSEVRHRRDALDQQLGQYADQLAGGDPVLRERLRCFEQRVLL